MSYERIYREFIEDRREREAGLEVFDKHHITPRCIGGGDEPENIIRLSHGDHLFAHILLARIHGPPLVMPAVRMSGMQKYRGRSSRERYDFLRQLLRREMLGNTRGKGVPRSDAMRARMSEVMKGNQRRPKGSRLSDEHKKRIGDALRGKPKSAEHRAKMSANMMGNAIARRS